MGSLLVDSSPSKKFFLDMITKDVSVESCIMDLIDNSIDAHKRLKQGKESTINIKYSIEEDFFSICDDCGGMSKLTAQEKAFKFGNQEQRHSNTLGMYGIGMKRSIFKIGKDFVVESKTDQDSFKVYMTQKEWLELEDIWKFYYEDVEYDFNNGVNIFISSLSESLKEFLSRKVNIDNLRKKIGSAYRELLAKDITIVLNDRKIDSVSEIFFECGFMKTFVKSIATPGVDIKIIAGIGSPNPKDAGWNIVSNGRVIIEKNRTELTGWEMQYNSEEDDDIDEVLDKKKVPAYHNDFARFRGYVFLTSDNANLLPLNTTKDGIDEQHKIYRLILKEMIDVLKLMLPKIRELMKVIRICKSEMKETPESTFVPISMFELLELETNQFKLELSEFTSSDKIKSVPVYLPAKMLDRLKTFFEVQSNRELGDELLTFVLERIDIQDE